MNSSAVIKISLTDRPCIIITEHKTLLTIFVSLREKYMSLHWNSGMIKLVFILNTRIIIYQNILLKMALEEFFISQPTPVF